MQIKGRDRSLPPAIGNGKPMQMNKYQAADNHPIVNRRGERARYAMRRASMGGTARTELLAKSTWILVPALGAINQGINPVAASAHRFSN